MKRLLFLLVVLCFTTTNSAAPLRIVAFGDSTTAPRNTVQQVYIDRLPALLKPAGMEVETINAGVGGSHTGRLADNAHHKRQHALDRLDQAVRAHKPDIVIVQFGINDSWVDQGGPESESRIPLATYERNLQQIVTALQTDGARVLVMTPNKIGGDKEQWRVERLAKYAGTARKVAHRRGAELVDIWQAFEQYEQDTSNSRDTLMLDGTHPNDAGHALVAKLLAEKIAAIGLTTVANGDAKVNDDLLDRVTLPLIDLNDSKAHQVVVDREAGQYLGHPTTCVLDDGRTMLCVYPKGHGRGAVVYKRSNDGGLTWSDRLPTPDNWETSKEVPTLFRVTDAAGKKRIIMWSGVYPARLAVTEDDGKTWSELKQAGDWGGIVLMGFVEPINTGKGHYLAMFHDRGGRATPGTGPRLDPDRRSLYKIISTDGGLTWSDPEAIYGASDVHLCEPGCIRSPDGKQLAVLLRENSRRMNSYIIFSNDEGKTWTRPRQLPLALTGDRHTGKYLPDGRLFISFRCRSPKAKADGRPYEGDWVGWLGTYHDLATGGEGLGMIRIKDNTKGYDCAYPGVEVLPDRTIVTTTYGHWTKGEQPYILTVRVQAADLFKQLSAGANE